MSKVRSRVTFFYGKGDETYKSYHSQSFQDYQDIIPAERDRFLSLQGKKKKI